MYQHACVSMCVCLQLSPDLRQQLGPVPLQALQRLQQEGRLAEGQEARHVGGGQPHHLTVLVEHLAGSAVSSSQVTPSLPS